MILTQENITSAIAVGAAIFAIFQYFRKPDVDADKNICLLKEMLNNLQQKNDLLLDIQKNHLHSLELAQQCTDKSVQELKISVSNLATIINERIPSKQ
ncbi:hypothetical protein A2619_04335 [candidate division WWE3 bacterium RIFOXYD1_FULL_39_9]|uniref:Uncharacterized protein n=1 Tax=candidate division WWE3 bacterium RIFOXYD1_FULL_39_9 TaxID=1802649 RepID=A0A1F4X556_UNCKA|nr:MAG: hypothetical protein A2619_04335 [candidate division WWE3 bacterium RIFOXYD1_FULL_39_9]